MPEKLKLQSLQCEAPDVAFDRPNPARDHTFDPTMTLMEPPYTCEDEHKKYNATDAIVKNH
jgi:hypothetical protein